MPRIFVASMSSVTRSAGVSTPTTPHLSPSVLFPLSIPSLPSLATPFFFCTREKQPWLELAESSESGPSVLLCKEVCALRLTTLLGKSPSATPPTHSSTCFSFILSHLFVISHHLVFRWRRSTIWSSYVPSWRGTTLTHILYGTQLSSSPTQGR